MNTNLHTLMRNILKQLTALAGIALLMAIASAPAYSQDRIITAIKKAEKKTNIVNTTYTEHRDPSSHKLISIAKVLTFNYQPELYKAFLRAFEDERENTVSAIRNDEIMVYRFQDKKGSSMFTLGNKNGVCTVTMSWSSEKGRKNKDGSMIIIDDYGCPMDYTTTTIYSVPSLDDSNDMKREFRQEKKRMRQEAKRMKEEQRRMVREQKRMVREQQRMAREQQRMAREQQRMAREHQRRIANSI